MKQKIQKIICGMVFTGLVLTSPISATATNDMLLLNTISVDLYDSLLAYQQTKVNLEGWTTTAVNVRTGPNVESEILTTYKYNTLVTRMELVGDWTKILYEEGVAYIKSEFLSDEECTYQDYEVPEYSGKKTYMSYKAITSTGSKQYKLQKDYGYTGEYGVREVDGRFCVALGSYFNTSIGQYFDLILENGVTISCVMADAKADIHTDKNNIFTVANNCASEFVVDTTSLDSMAKRMGDLSYATEDWNSPVATIRVYEENILED